MVKLKLIDRTILKIYSFHRFKNFLIRRAIMKEPANIRRAIFWVENHYRSIKNRLCSSCKYVFITAILICSFTRTRVNYSLENSVVLKLVLTYTACNKTCLKTLINETCYNDMTHMSTRVTRDCIGVTWTLHFIILHVCKGGTMTSRKIKIFALNFFNRDTCVRKYKQFNLIKWLFNYDLQ